MANIIKSVELQPNDGRKSFYKKAIVHYHADGSTSLQSYSNHRGAHYTQRRTPTNLEWLLRNYG